MNRFPTRSLLTLALLGAFTVGGAQAQDAVHKSAATATTKDAAQTAAAEADVARNQAQAARNAAQQAAASKRGGAMTSEGDANATYHAYVADRSSVQAEQAALEATRAANQAGAAQSAAAGGTGSLSVQLAKRAGAKVIGLASSAEKRALVERLGADATVDSGGAGLKDAILEANGGERVDAVLHMSGGDAFDAELSALAPLGRMVVFGIASREQRDVSTAALLRGSKAVIGFWLVHLLARRDLAAPMIGELLGAVAAGDLEVTVGGVYPLSEAARAHEDIISRRTTGKLLLDPSR